MKRRLSKGAHIPLIVVHGVRTKDNANRVVDRERYHKRIASLGIAVAGIDLVIRPPYSCMEHCTINVKYLVLVPCIDCLSLETNCVVLLKSKY